MKLPPLFHVMQSDFLSGSSIELDVRHDGLGRFFQFNNLVITVRNLKGF
jgi:hypothetical protein